MQIRFQRVLCQTSILVFAVIGLAVGVGCGPKSSIGFTLPDGDIQRGSEAFVRLQCHACHSVEGIEPLPGDPERELVELGGTVTRVKTYGQLVTSIINPSHRLASGYTSETVQTPDGESKMRNYNEVMTVDELIDLVAFLQSKYTIAPTDPTYYPNYPMYY